VFSGEAINTNFIVFGFTRPRLEPTIYFSGGEHANHYTTDAVLTFDDVDIMIYKPKKLKFTETLFINSYIN
jgi:hypothetical protein